MKRIYSIITASFLILTWCGMASAVEIGYGEIENGIYKNEYFNMSIEVPKGWAVQSKAALTQLSDRGGELIAGDDKNLRAVLKESEKQSVHLFAFFKYEQGTPVDFNPSIIAVAENVAYMPGIKSGSDYLYHVKKLLQAGRLKYSFPKEIYTKEISGISFDVMPAEIAVTDKVIYQNYYAARIKDYALGFVLSYSSEAEINELNQIVDQLKIAEE